RWCCRSYHRLAPLARDDKGVVVHTADSPRPLGMTGEEHGSDWNELHAGTPARQQRPKPTLLCL
ncbi:MAG: hypothetical protein ABF451_07720, partial [Bifidobacterium aquikefiri]|uniref:hypothetical protein n=1 Tax=Bifidobacterium aquikefiri TaxID=1653207 RepID=UPI0039E7ABD4